MRLDKLTILGKFKNLKGFTIDFDEESSTTILVGRNGTGKSNLLEALTIIFRDLDLGEPPAFPYVLEYVCRGRKIKIAAFVPGDKNESYIFVDGTRIPYGQISQAEGRSYLPNYVFGYYSGPTNRMEQHFVKHQERFYSDLLKGVDRPLRPLFYARPIHSQFVLLAFFLKEEEETRRFLNERLRIEGLDSILFVMAEPPWKSKQGDSRFWNARGTVSQLLDGLYGLSLAPLRRTQRVSAGFRRTTAREHLYLYLKDVEALRGLAEPYGSQQEFFKALESTYMSQLVSEVRIRVKARNVDGSLTFRELSEGEQQLLMVLGLLRFTKEDESLFLLDEPDTHLNPAWSLEYLDMIGKVVGEQPNSHIIMATHDPLVIAGLTRSQVRIMQMDVKSSAIHAAIPERDPRGMGVAGLLTSDVYGLRSQLDLATLHLLDQKRVLATKDELSADEKQHLKELTEQLAGLEMASAVRDPLYQRFARALAEAEGAPGSPPVALSPEQVQTREELARRVLANIRQVGSKEE